MDVKAMVLAAGVGSRLRPYTDTLPKPMIPLAGRPILEHNVALLAGHGVRQIAMNLHHLPDVIRSHFGDGGRWGVSIVYSYEEEPLGTAGGVGRLRDFFDATFFLLYGDNLVKCRLDRMLALHREKSALATVAMFHREDVTQSGIIGVDGDGRITRFLEKPRPEEVFSHRVNAGVLVLEPAVFGYIPRGGTPDFGRDVLPAMLAAGEPLYGYEMSADEGLWWVDTPADLERVSGELNG